MLAVTENASLAIEGILNSGSIPEGAGIRIASSSGEEGATSGELEVTIVGSPADSDQVIDCSGGRVFVEDTVAPLLEDKLLDVDVAEDQIHFVLSAQDSTDGEGPTPDGSHPG